MKIGNVQLPSNIVAAPIAGYSDAGMRALCARYGAGFTVTELVSAKGLCYKNKNTDELLTTTDEEKTKCVQIFGSDPDFMERAAAHEKLKKFDIIDINMGCPVRKVVNNGDGCALMENPKLVEEIVRAVVRGAGGRPVTVKMRAGLILGKPLAVECARAAEAGGASAVTVHPRYRDQFYSGTADHEITAAVKNALKIPVIANGDITDKESLESIAKLTNADGFMVGRASLGKPWIFAELDDDALKIDVKAVICEHIAILRGFVKDRVACNAMKAHLCNYAKNTQHAKAIRTSICTVKTMDDIFAVINNFF